MGSSARLSILTLVFQRTLVFAENTTYAQIQAAQLISGAVHRCADKSLEGWKVPDTCSPANVEPCIGLIFTELCAKQNINYTECFGKGFPDGVFYQSPDRLSRNW